MKVSIPDDLIDALEAANPNMRVVSATGVASQAFQTVLKAVISIPLNKPYLILTSETLDRLQQVLGLGSIKDAESLVKAAEHLASLKIGDIALDFTVGEWAELKRRAEYNQRSVHTEAELVVRSMHEQFFSQPLGV